jgi:tRNA(fMet)-specific endonuclease VapC
MRRYLLDSGVLSDYVSRRNDVVERVKEATHRGIHVGTATPVVGELFAGAEYSTSRVKSLDRLRHALATMVAWSFDRSAAREYGRIFAELRRIGRPMQQIDIQIAAISIVIGQCTVITYDSDLEAIPRLKVQNWLKQANTGRDPTTDR